MSDNGKSAKKKEGLESAGAAARKRAPASSSSSSPPPNKKRPRVTCNDEDEDEASNSNNIPRDEYQGFTFSSSSSSPTNEVLEIDRLTATITPETFFERYIATRRPCVLCNLNNNNKHLLTLQDLKSLDGAESLICQVERRPNPQTQFGQNRTMPEYMQELSLMEIMERLQDDNTKHLYYLSTQQESASEKKKCSSSSGNDSHNKKKHDDDNEVPVAPTDFSPLTQKLVQAGLIQDRLPLAGNLILQSCHLWMGGAGGSGSSSGSGSSNSGLHHDFHDNFYLLQAGRKRFTLYPPNAAIPVFGQRECVHANGLISYMSNPTRADGVPLSLCHHPLNTTIAAAAINNIDNESEEEDDDEEEVVLGKGFDYQSDTDDDDNAGAASANFNDEEAAVDDYDALFGNDKDETGEQPNGDGDDDDDYSNGDVSQKKAAVTTTASTKENGANKKASNDSRPDSFSPVNLSIDPKELHTAFPIMKTILVPPPVIVEIQAGECLYLPASWFHCVESFANDRGDCNDNNSGMHMAVNYWYHPPDRLDHFADPYMHDFWKRKTLKKA